MPKPKPKWVYGDPAPRNWREVADVLKSFRKPSPSPKPKPNQKDSK